ncbi:MAG: hypothetical protein PVF45_15160, partial [Anaerolineae bacterium]
MDDRTLTGNHNGKHANLLSQTPSAAQPLDSGDGATWRGLDLYHPTLVSAVERVRRWWRDELDDGRALVLAGD